MKKHHASAFTSLGRSLCIPVHQDGTCNKLQNGYYEAVCGDVLGAQQIHVLASDQPSVVYTDIRTSLACWCGSGDGGGKQSELSHLLRREQIEKQLKDCGDIPAKLSWSASAYLAKKVRTYSGHGPDTVRSFNG